LLASAYRRREERSGVGAAPLRRGARSARLGLAKELAQGSVGAAPALALPLPHHRGRVHARANDEEVIGALGLVGDNVLIVPRGQGVVPLPASCGLPPKLALVAGAVAVSSGLRKVTPGSRDKLRQLHQLRLLGLFAVGRIRICAPALR